MHAMINLIQRSTIHGVNHIYSATSKITKVLWVFLFLFGLFSICINIFYVTMKYFSHPVINSYTLDYEEFIWPDLTFCNPSAPYHFKRNSTALKHWKHASNKSREIAAILKNETFLFQLIHAGEQHDIELEERTITMASTDPQILDKDWYGNEFLHVAYTKQHSGIFFTKEYKGSRPTYINEDIKPMFSTQIVQIGNNIPCHTFHIEKATTLNSNSTQSLKFILKLDHRSHRIFNSSYVHRSIFLYVTSNNGLPNGKEIILTPGFSNKVTLSQSRYQYDEIRRHCRHERFLINLYDALLQKTEEYEGDFENCKEIVSQELFVINCNCYSPFLPIYKLKGVMEPKLCLNATYFSRAEIVKNAKCMVDVFQKYKDKKLFNEIFDDKCKKYKPMKCDSITYKMDESKEMFIEVWSNSSNDRRMNSIKKFYQAYYGEKVVTNDFMYKIRDSQITLTIERQNEFGDLYKEQNEYPFSELLSDIGGLMGLWLGMSVIGLFEVVEFFFIYLASVCLEDKSKSEEDKNTVKLAEA